MDPAKTTLLMISGLSFHLIINVILQQPLKSLVGLVGVVLVGLSIESAQIWLAYRGSSLNEMPAGYILDIVYRHSTDVALMLIAPAVFILAAALIGKSKSRNG